MWGVKWRSKSKASGKLEYLLWDEELPAIFKTRKAAREWIKHRYGYVAERKDLRAEPHGWRMPIPVRVRIEEVLCGTR